MECFAEALSTADIKKQKQLLRIIKRLISSRFPHGDADENGWQGFIDVLQGLVNTKNSTSAEEAAVQGLVQEILVKLGLTK